MLWQKFIQQATYHEQNQRYYGEQAAYHHNYIDRQAESYSGSFASRLAGVGRRMWNMVTSGFKRMANGVRRTFYGEPTEEKLFDDQLEDVAGPLGDLFGPSEAVQDIVASNAWTVPAAGLATGLLFQTQIEDLVEDLIGKQFCSSRFQIVYILISSPYQALPDEFPFM